MSLDNPQEGFEKGNMFKKLYNQYKDEADRLEKEYESRYGRICLGINEDFNWDWVKSPWPWERM